MIVSSTIFTALSTPAQKPLGDAKYKFIFCPWGNGFDTHRIWEALYCGSIPITKSHVGLSFGSLPIISFENFNNLSIEKLITESNKKDYNFEPLNLKYWNQLVKRDVNLSDKFSESIQEINHLEFLFWSRIRLLGFINSKLKILSKDDKVFLTS